MRFFLLDDRAQRRAIEHVDHMMTVRDLHGRRVGVAIHRDHLDAQALQFDQQFLAQLTRTTKQDANGAGRQRSANSWHGIPR